MSVSPRTWTLQLDMSGRKVASGPRLGSLEPVPVVELEPVLRMLEEQVLMLSDGERAPKAEAFLREHGRLG